MKTFTILLGLLLAAGSVPAQQAPVDPAVDKVMGAVESLSALVDNFDTVANSPVPANSTAPANALRNGSAKAAIARATAGAAAGAAIGAMTRKGDRAVLAGAIIGAVAGLVYDRVKVSQEHRADVAQSNYGQDLPPCAVPTQDPTYVR